MIRTLLILACFFMVERFCHRETQGFRLSKVRSTLTHDPRWETTSNPPVESIKAPLSQPYYFLNSGGEAYAFVSEDGHYVLKLFKHHHMRPKSPLDFLIPPPFKNRWRNRRIEKLETLFTSCKLAADLFREETALIYLHLNKTRDLNIKLKLFDPIGCRHKISLDALEFALQKRAAEAYPTLTALVAAGEIEGAKRRVESLITLIETRCNAGLADHDARKRNFGFVGSNAVEFDLGSFSYNRELKTSAGKKKVLMLESLRLRSWLKKNHPELVEVLDDAVSNKLRNNL